MGGGGGYGGNGGIGESPYFICNAGHGGGGGNGGAGSNSGSGGRAYFKYTTLYFSFTTITMNSSNESIGYGSSGGNGGQGGTCDNGAQASSGGNGSKGGNGSRGSYGGVYGNFITSIALKNTIISGNNSPVSPDCGYSTFYSQGYNISASPCFGSLPQDKTYGNALPLNLGSLSDNWSTIPSHAVLPGSVALDVIPMGTNGCGTETTTDQRGFPRPANGYCEIGAYEVQLMNFLPLILKFP